MVKKLSEKEGLIMTKLVGITSCSNGIAHTYMTAEAIKKECKKYGLNIHIEMQGQLGPENEISQKEFDEADAIVLCCGVLPIGPERFEKYQDKTVSINWNEVLKKPNIVINALKEAGLIDKNLEMKK